jgi:hypothetical protein
VAEFADDFGYDLDEEGHPLEDSDSERSRTGEPAAASGRNGGEAGSGTAGAEDGRGSADAQAPETREAGATA